MNENVEHEQSEVSDSSLEDRIAGQLFGNEAEESDEQPQPEAEGDEPEAETSAADEQTEKAPELVEVEFSGKQYKLPPELKDALMAQADYTRKTQEVAEQRRMVDQHMLLMQQEAQFQQAVSQESAQLQQLDWQLAAYKGLDWSSMDTETMTRTRVAMDQLRDARNEIAQTVEAKRGQFQQHMQGLMQQAREKGVEYLKRHIPNWGPDVGRELTNYAINEGYSDVELGTLTDARMIKTLWKARQWDALQSQRGATSKRAEKAPPVVKPGASKPQSQVEADVTYKKALKAAKTSSEKQRVIQSRLERMFG